MIIPLYHDTGIPVNRYKGNKRIKTRQAFSPDKQAKRFENCCGFYLYGNNPYVIIPSVFTLRS